MKLSTLNYIHNVLKENYKNKQMVMQELDGKEYSSKEYIHTAWELKQATDVLKEFEENNW